MAIGSAACRGVLCSLTLVASSAIRVAPALGQTAEIEASSTGQVEDRPEVEPGEDREAEAAPPQAVERTQPRVLEEIIVTAQKSEQRLHDVPISMAVFDDDFLEQESLTDLRELSQRVPNVKVLSTFFIPRANMRGFGIEEANKGLESPVGLTIDGVSYGNPTYLETAFLDVSRVEVLRGPQNTLFGKNNSVGLFNVVTQDPTDQFNAFFDVEIGEPERRRFEGAVGGPVVPGLLSFRIAALFDEREGFLDNTTADVVPEAFETMVGSDRKAVRVKAELPDLFGADLVLSYEKFDIEASGTGFELSVVPEGTRDFFLLFDPNADFDFGDFVNSTDYPSTVNLDIDTFTGNASRSFGDWVVDAVVGYSVLRVDNDLDADHTPAPIIFAFTKDTNSQTTLELRQTSPRLTGVLGLERLLDRSLGWSDFTAGLFYQRRQVTDSEFTAAFDTVLIGAAAAMGMFPPPAGIPLPPLPVPPEAIGSQIEETTMFWEQTSDTIAGFGQVNWHFADRWTLAPGLRLGNEWKAADWERVFGETVPVFLNAAGFEEFTAHLERSELQLAPKANLKYDVTDDVNVFATWARGFRGGGFNEFATTNANLEFDPETVTDWELGTNAEVLDGAARLNLVLFWMTITDFQILTDDPETGFNEIKNAPEARARGVEADGTWLATSWLTVRGSLGFNDSEFVDFPFGPCTIDRGNTDGDEDPRCDLSGETIHNAPKWVIDLTPSVSFPLSRIPVLDAMAALLSSGLDMVGSLTVGYQDTQLLAPTLDPRTREGSSFHLDGSLGFESLDQGWSLAVTVKNLTDELITEEAREVSLFGGHFLRVANAPRHVFGGLRWRF